MKALFRPSLSTILVLFFFFILLFLGLFAEVFESQSPEVDIAQIYANPIPLNEIQRLNHLKLVNKHGTFILENTHVEGALEGPWQMLAPQVLRLKSDIITKLIDALNVIRVRNFHRLEPINITSFSLDNPTLTLLFTNDKNKKFEIKMGLINPIDNSAYLSLSSQDQIYQIDPIEMALESYDLSALAEARVLAVNPQSLQSLEISGPEGVRLKILKKDGNWLDQNSSVLADGKLTNFLDKLAEMKSFSILDKLNTDQQILLEKTMATPTYQIKLITTQGIRTYLVGPLPNKIPGLVGIKKDSFILSTDEKQSFIMLERDEIKILSTKSSDLK
jgi:hypothetical protein